MQRANLYMFLITLFVSVLNVSAGHYYDFEGNYLGTDSLDDEKVYIATNLDSTKLGKERFVLARDLGVKHYQFAVAANIIRHESVDGEELEVLYIAHTVHNRAMELEGEMYSLLMTGYSSVPRRLKKEMRTDDSRFGSNNTRAAVIDVLLGKPDPTDGATFWDGTDFLAWGLRSPNGTPQNKFEEYKSIEIPMDVFYEYLHRHCDKYPWDYVRYYGRTYQFPAKVFTVEDHWVGQSFKYNTGADVPYGIKATVTAGLTIFWKTVS